MKKYFIFALFALITSSIFSIGKENIDWSTGEIFSSVIVEAKNDHNFAHNRLKQIEIGREKAKVNFYGILKKINLDESKSVLDFIEEIEDRRNDLFSLIDKAKIHKFEYPSLNSIKITYSINLYGESSLMNMIIPDEETFTEKLESVSGYNLGSQYTGILIDARGDLNSFDGVKTRIKPSVFVTVKDNKGKIIFNRYNIFPEILKTKGMVRYSYDINEDQVEKVGKKPFKIVAFGAGDRKGSIIVITELDAERILGSDKTKNFIQNGNIVIVINPDKND
jgi:hypothetical protein